MVHCKQVVGMDTHQKKGKGKMNGEKSEAEIANVSRVLDDVLLVFLIYLWKERESFLQPLKHLRI